MDNKLKEYFAKFREFLNRVKWAEVWHNCDIALQVIRKVILNFIALGILVFALLIGIGVGYTASILNHETIPTYKQMNELIHDFDQSSVLYFADASPIGEIHSDIISKRVDSKDISPWVKKAIVASEDEDFYIHHGVMPRAIVRAVIADLTGSGLQTGGSTITQQLVKMQILSSETTFKRKATEIFLAMRVNKFFSKDDILTSYLNAASFGRNNKGENISGISAAATGIFGKSPKDLSIAQSAFVVGLVQSPYAYTPYDVQGNINPKTLNYGLKRSKIVLFRMYRDGQISKKQYNDALKDDLTKEFLPREDASQQNDDYGYAYATLKEQATDILADVLIKQNKLNPDKIKEATYNRYYRDASTKLSQNGYRIYSTLDKNLSNDLQSVLSNSRSLFNKTYQSTVYDTTKNNYENISEPVQNGTIVLDNKTGAVIGFTGGVDFKTSQFNHAFDNKRSPGSSIKPLLVYGPAIDTGLIGSQSVIADFPAKYDNYEPSDYGQTFQNRFVSATDALANSYNVPAVNLYQAMIQKDPKLGKSYLDKMNINLTDKEYSELGVSLGGVSSGVSPLQEASAYATFAENGEYQKPYLIAKIEDPSGKTVYQHKSEPVKVYSPATAYILRKMMKDVVQSGTATSLSSNVTFDSDKISGKTGTSNDNRDLWFTGSTPGITISSWMGYDNLYGHTYYLGENDSDVNLRLVARYLNKIYTTNPKILKLDEEKSKPKDVKEYNVLAKTGTLPDRLETSFVNMQVRGTLVKSLYAKGKPKGMSTHFGIGGYASDYRLFWSNYLGQSNGYGIVSKATDNMKYDTSEPEVYFARYVTPRISYSASYRYQNNVNSNTDYGNFSGYQGYLGNQNNYGSQKSFSGVRNKNTTQTNSYNNGSS